MPITHKKTNVAIEGSMTKGNEKPTSKHGSMIKYGHKFNIKQMIG